MESEQLNPYTFGNMSLFMKSPTRGRAAAFTELFLTILDGVLRSVKIVFIYDLVLEDYT